MASASIQQQGANSASYTIADPTGGEDAISNANLVAGLGASRIKDFLAATYADEAAVNLAWARLGGSWSGVNAKWIQWQASASAPSLILMTHNSSYATSLRLSLAYRQGA